MNENEFLKQLNTLRHITPSQHWKRESFAVLQNEMKKVSAAEKPAKGMLAIQTIRAFFSDLPFQIAPLAVLLLLFTAGGFVVLNTSQGSLPGNFLYPIKLNIERAQLAFVGNSAQRAELSIEFTKNRVQELDRLMLSKNSLTTDKNAEIVAQTIKQNIDRVKETVTRQKSGKDFHFMIALSLESTSTEIKETINKSKGILSEDVKNTLQEALDSAEETGLTALIKSIEILPSDDATTVTDPVDDTEQVDEALEILKTKIFELEQEQNTIETRLNAVADSITPEDRAAVEQISGVIDTLIAESKQALSESNYDKITENSKLIRELFNKIAKVLASYSQAEAQLTSETNTGAEQTDTNVDENSASEDVSGENTF